ncbi:MAG: right-handed parallel beta-helix repeat-containing protein, partial [Clostridia bacterium]|nr:right-handed parallel beta-helix repeat-containing protein [Clostridia bacterium]
VDDAINVHGFYTRIERITDRNKAVARLVHPSQAGLNLYGKGDVLKVSHGDNMQEYANVTIKDSCIRDQVAEILLEFEEDVVGWLKVGDFLENNGRTPEVEIRNCFFSDFPAIRLSSGKKMVFESNVVKNCNGLLVNDLMRYWYLTGCVNGLEIKDNRFENMEKAISIFVDREGESNVRHKNIAILRNHFVNCRTGIEAGYVDGLTIRDNLFEGVATPILLRECEKVDCQKLP